MPNRWAGNKWPSWGRAVMLKLASISTVCYKKNKGQLELFLGTFCAHILKLNWRIFSIPSRKYEIAYIVCRSCYALLGWRHKTSFNNKAVSEEILLSTKLLAKTFLVNISEKKFLFQYSYWRRDSSVYITVSGRMMYGYDEDMFSDRIAT